jgi:enoyl-CoA hydratase
MPETYATIQLTVADGIGHIRMNRPKQLTALSSQMMGEMLQALTALENDAGVKAIVLSAEGRAFSAGFDLKESAAKKPTTLDDWTALLEADFAFIMRFWDCPKPTVAAVHGYCLAGALELALACDLTVADSTAIFGEPEVRFGSAIVALLVPWIVGPKFAKELLLTGADDITAQRALQMGLVNQVVDAGQALTRATELATAMRSAAAHSVRLTKQAINRSLDIRGLRESLKAGLDTAKLIEANMSPERIEFNRIRASEGLKAAIAWRNAQGAASSTRA